MMLFIKLKEALSWQVMQINDTMNEKIKQILNVYADEWQARLDWMSKVVATSLNVPSSSALAALDLPFATEPTALAGSKLGGFSSGYLRYQFDVDVTTLPEKVCISGCCSRLKEAEFDWLTVHRYIVEEFWEIKICLVLLTCTVVSLHKWILNDFPDFFFFSWYVSYAYDPSSWPVTAHLLIFVNTKCITDCNQTKHYWCFSQLRF